MGDMKMKKFEYKMVTLKSKFSFNDDEKIAYQEKQLNELGAQGWELVEFKLINGLAVLKKEILQFTINFFKCQVRSVSEKEDTIDDTEFSKKEVKGYHIQIQLKDETVKYIESI